MGWPKMHVFTWDPGASPASTWCPATLTGAQKQKHFRFLHDLMYIHVFTFTVYVLISVTKNKLANGSSN